MTPRYARFGGWVFLSCVVGLVVACSTPTIGTAVDDTQGASSKRDKRGSSEKSTKSTKTTDDGEDGENDTPATETTAVPTATSTATTAPSGTATTAPTGTTPAVTHPACGNADPIACLECCLDANPSASAFEDEYDSCMAGCRGNLDCLDDCQAQHASRCAANTSCKKHHACMEANDCLQQNYCNPL